MKIRKKKKKHLPEACLAFPASWISRKSLKVSECSWRSESSGGSFLDSFPDAIEYPIIKCASKLHLKYRQIFRG